MRVKKLDWLCKYNELCQDLYLKRPLSALAHLKLYLLCATCQEATAHEPVARTSLYFIPR